MNEQKFELVATGLYTGRGEPVMKKVRIIKKKLRMRDERSHEEVRKRKSLAKAKRVRKAAQRRRNHYSQMYPQMAGKL